MKLLLNSSTQSVSFNFEDMLLSWSISTPHFLSLQISICNYASFMLLYRLQKPRLVFKNQAFRGIGINHLETWTYIFNSDLGDF